MKTIITIQHTESIHHTNGMVGSWTDWDITEKGIIQAQNIANKLKEELKDKEVVIYSSDLLRAKHTAEIIGNALGKEIILKQELRERNLGKCCGKSVEWLRANKEMVEVTVDDKLFSDAESKREVFTRLKPLFCGIINCTNENVIIVSHGDLLSVFNILFLGLDVEVINNIELFGLSGGVSKFIIRDDGKRIIRKLSDMSYIEPIKKEYQ